MTDVLFKQQPMLHIDAPVEEPVYFYRLDWLAAKGEPRSKPLAGPKLDIGLKRELIAAAEAQQRRISTYVEGSMRITRVQSLDDAYLKEGSVYPRPKGT